ncbi:MAG: MATE family efflux transporter, partial [Eisenbergiella sp.]
MGMNIFIALSNLFFDWLFIVHFRMGVSSAALASCISLTLGTGIGLFPFFGKKLVLRFVSPRIPWHILRNIIGNGSSEFFSNISASVSMVIMNAVLLRLSGAMAVATFSIVMYIDSFVSSMLFGMVDALQPAISYNFGAAKYTRMFRLEKILMTAGAVISISAMAFMLTGGHLIIPFFMEGDQPELTAMASRAMHLFSFSYLFNWIGTAAGSFFTAMNKPAVSLAVSFGQT